MRWWHTHTQEKPPSELTNNQKEEDTSKERAGDQAEYRMTSSSLQKQTKPGAWSQRPDRTRENSPSSQNAHPGKREAKWTELLKRQKGEGKNTEKRKATRKFKSRELQHPERNCRRNLGPENETPQELAGI